MHADPITPGRQPDLIDPNLIDWNRLDECVLLALARRIQGVLQIRTAQRNGDDLLSPVKAARAVRCHHRQIYEAIRQNELKAETRKWKGGRQCSLIVRRDLMTWWHKVAR